MLFYIADLPWSTTRSGFLSQLFVQVVLARIVRLRELSRELFISFFTKFKRGFTNVVVTRAGCFNASTESDHNETSTVLAHARYTCLRFVRASLSTTYWIGNSCTVTSDIKETNTITFLVVFLCSEFLFWSAVPKPNNQGKRSFSVLDMYVLEGLKWQVWSTTKKSRSLHKSGRNMSIKVYRQKRSR